MSSTIHLSYYATSFVWLQKSVEMGDAPSKAFLASYFLYRGARAAAAGVAEDAARGFELLRQAFAEGFSKAFFQIAQCYLHGVGVEKDAAHAVSLLRQAAGHGDEETPRAQAALALCYKDGVGVEADTVQAALWCQRAADSGYAIAIEMLPIIRTCDFCGTTPARQHCERCRKVRYCDAGCQAGHWKRETDPHKRHCRRRAPEASEEGTAPGGGGGGGGRGRPNLPMGSQFSEE